MHVCVCMRLCLKMCLRFCLCEDVTFGKKNLAKKAFFPSGFTFA